MHRERVEATAIVIAIGAYAASTATNAPTAFTVVFGLALLIAPGYLASRFTVRFGATLLERALVAVACTIVVPILGGLLLHVVGVRLDLTSCQWLLSCVAGLGSFALLLSARDNADMRRKRWHFETPIARRIILPGAMILAAVFICSGAVTLAHEGASRGPQGPNANLWLVPQLQEGAAEVGIQNDGRLRQSYELVVTDHGRVLSRRSVSLSPGQRWQSSIRNSSAGQLGADLYRANDLMHVYRHVGVGEAAR
jgi:hypothetical protein